MTGGTEEIETAVLRHPLDTHPCRLSTAIDNREGREGTALRCRSRRRTVEGRQGFGSGGRGAKAERRAASRKRGGKDGDSKREM